MATIVHSTGCTVEKNKGGVQQICLSLQLFPSLPSSLPTLPTGGSAVLSRGWLSATPWTAAHQALLFMGFSKQVYWSRLPFPPPGDLPNPGIKPWSPTLQADSLPSEPPGKPMNTGVGSLSLLQGFFQTQESNWGCLFTKNKQTHRFEKNLWLAKGK